MSKQAFDYEDDGDLRDETTPWKVIVCAGPPKCTLQGHSAVIAANLGCPNCRHLLQQPDGTQTEYQRKAN